MDKTIYRAFFDSVIRYPNRNALMYRKEGRYVGITYQELSGAITAVSASLWELGIRKGDRVAIMSYNRPEWVIADLAVMKLGGIVVPLYHTPGHLLPVANVQYLLNDSQAKLIFLENRELFTLIEQIKTELPALEQVVLFDHGQAGEKGYLRFVDMKQKGEGLPDEVRNISGDDVATIVYTSGTTGEPKGVMLTHNNIVTNAFAAIARYHFNPKDVVLSYLPLSHMFERTCCYYAVLFGGGSIGYAEDLTTVVRDAEIIRPTIFLAVPRVLEKAFNVGVQKVNEGSPLKRRLVASAIKNLNRRVNLQYRRKKIPFGLKLKCGIYNALVAKKFKKLGGGRIRLIVSGGAPLNRQIARVIHALGYTIVEGWGLTETAPVSTCGIPEDYRIGTVGKPFLGIEVRIGENDEVLVRGPNVMKGYFNKPEETAKAIDRDGWLHTGDQGRFDKYGNLIITGRIKELIVLSSGKNIAPAPLEAKLTSSPYIDQVLICGNNRPYLVAFVVPSREALERYARENDIPVESYSSLLARDEIKALIQLEIEKATQALPSYEQLKAFVLLEEGFTVENGMLTPTLKIRRDRVLEKHRSVLGALYRDKMAREGGQTLVYL